MKYRRYCNIFILGVPFAKRHLWVQALQSAPSARSMAAMCATLASAVMHAGMALVWHRIGVAKHVLQPASDARELVSMAVPSAFLALDGMLDGAFLVLTSARVVHRMDQANVTLVTVALVGCWKMSPTWDQFVSATGQTEQISPAGNDSEHAKKWCCGQFVNIWHYSCRFHLYLLLRRAIR